MIITYNSRPYELTYCGKLIEKYTKLKEHVDFEFGACNPTETPVVYLRDMKKEELDSVQSVFDNPIVNDDVIKKEILKNQHDSFEKKCVDIVKTINGKDIIVVHKMNNNFDDLSETIDYEFICSTTILDLNVGDSVIIENLNKKPVITAKIF